jgi:hypothetical protein
MPEQLSNEALPLSERTRYAYDPYWPLQGSFALSGAMNFLGFANPNIFAEQPTRRGNYQTIQQPQTVQKPSFRGRITAPVRSLLALFDRWQLSDQDAAKLLGVAEAQFVIDLRVGTTGLSTKDMEDRARLLLRIYEGVHSLLRQPEAERSWINAPMPMLSDQTILDTMLRGSMVDLARVRAFVDHANGR